MLDHSSRKEQFAAQLLAELTPLSWEERLKKLTGHSGQSIAFSTSFSLEDQALTHTIAENTLPIRVFTIDTGRLFAETYETFQKTRDTYFGVEIETYYPDTRSLEALVKKQGVNGFYESVEKRKSCCFVRKVEPLNRALAATDVWISGLRREHSDNRADLPVVEYDAGRDIIKVYPLIDLSEADVRAYIQNHAVPYNPLHDRGFPSIGCAPCTRAVNPGDHPRSGRWWWEQENDQECGLHIKDGKLVRIKQTAHA
ncbi:MAG: phosphoadenylyl-sulfate reductase [Rhodospirillales bacterium]|nr:phosphoadenylyl-sulfate reductase [Alphaproteobacteria bacterium]MCB1841075.1 phosphoadenylyl-sulfate reductase [Alphaproteobacteria bacterium]MCB9977201.1 phosphoadenylyl-sulfate reductase [Rhodospirillales bacterium]